MNKGVKTLIYPVKDMARAKTQFRTLLGAEPYGDQPYYIGFKGGDQTRERAKEKETENV